MLDEGEIRQLLLNLARNALDAMPPNKGLPYRPIGKVKKLFWRSGIRARASILIFSGNRKTFCNYKKTALVWVWQFVSVLLTGIMQVEVESSQSGSTFYVRFKLPLES